ncbi:hypothetical protein [Myxococcus sp. CA039A]|uniref:hypothetical protein n=1 Tax=Myxococcus sp. CA039A TaxID=2741737 RepID=UPI00157A59F9|nr:hypothetical protein [Myxococcus sp. CA039A]NTX33875.1 hypothetical protein [Myxococcus sp. CA033]NTX52168.1 hypothetical protein [Myxococcus sp. CA039A]
MTDLSVLGERCSKAAVAYAEVELAGCAQVVLGEWTGEVFEMKEGDWGWFRKLRGMKLLPGRSDAPWSSDQPP